MTSLGLLAMLSIAGTADTVTLTVPASSVKVVVAKVAQESGAKLSVAEAVSGEIVLLRVKDAPLKEVMDRIAATTSCKWVEDSEGNKWLRPDEDLRRKQARAELEARTAEVQKQLERLWKSLEPKPEAKEGPTADPMEAMLGANTPVQKAIAKMSKSLSASTLAAMKDGDRVVYATSPTRMQKPLGNVASIVAELVSENNKAAEAQEAARRKADEDKTNEQKRAEQQMEEMFGGWFGAGPAKRINAPPAKVLLIAMRGGGFMGVGNDLALTLKIYDSNGTVILTGRQQLELGDMGFMSRVAVPEEKPAQAPSGKQVKLSPLTAEFLRFGTYSPMSAAGLERTVSNALMERILKPDTYDPLGYLHSEALIALAENRNVNLVACLPDSIVSFVDTFSDRAAVTDEGFYSTLLESGEVKETASAGWISLEPKEPTQSRENRLDRKALARLLLASYENGTPSLDDMADYAMTNKSPYNTPVALPYLIYFAPNAVNPGMSGMLNWNLLRFYGTLSAAQKTALQSGARLPFRTLMPNQTALVERMLFGADSKLKVLSSERPRGEGGFMDMIRAFMPAVSKDFKDEPTEIMPNGLPADGFLRANRGDGMFVMPVGNDSETSLRMFGALGSDEFAMLEYLRTDPNLSQFTGQMPKIERVRVGSRTTWDFVFTVAPDVGATDSLQDDRIDKNGQILNVDALPQSWKDRVARRVDAFRRNPMNFPGMGGGPPPPNP